LTAYHSRLLVAPIRALPKSAGLLLALLVGLSFAGFPAISFLSLALGIVADQSRLLTVPYRGLVLALSLIVFFSAWQRHSLHFHHRTHRLILIFWTVYLFRMAYEISAHGGELTVPSFYIVGYAFGICLGSALGFLQPLDDRVQRLAPWFIWAFAVTANLSGVIFRGEEIALTERLSVNELLNPISYGQCAVTQIILTAYLTLRTKNGLRATALILTAVPAVYILATTASRSPLLSLLAGGVLVAIYGFKMNAKHRTYAGLAVSAIVVLVGLRYLFLSDSALTTRVAYTIEDLRHGGEVDRFVLWRAAWDQYVSSPFIGRGLEITGVGYPHNLAIESLMTMGFVGLALFLGLMYSFFRDSVCLMRHRNTAWMPLLAAQFFVLSLFSGSLYSSPEFWSIVFLQAGTAEALSRASRHSPPLGHPANPRHELRMLGQSSPR
jgi:O-antigen ligase